MIERSEYNDLMAKIADGGKVNRKTYEDLVEFAKARKTKRPSEDAVIDEAAIAGAATTVAGTPDEKPAKAPKAPKAPKEPKAKAKCDPGLHKSDEKCDKDARSNGVCATHYSRLVYRARPENAEKAREASKAYAKRIREEKAEAKAKAEAEKPAESDAA